MPDTVFHAEMIGAFFAFFAGRSLEQPTRGDRERAWREGLRRGARFLTEGIRPGRSRESVLALATRIGQALGQPPFRPW